MAQTMCRRWAICFGPVLVIILVSGCNGALDGAAPPATVSPTTAESPGKPGQAVAATVTAVSTASPTALPQTATPSPVAAAGADSSVVDGWIGTIVKLDSMAQFDGYFRRADGERYGIDGSAAGLTAQIENARRGETAKQGAPCRGSLQATDEKAPTDAAQAASLSPGDSYRATTREEQSGDVRLKVTTTSADARSGQPVQVVEYPHRTGHRWPWQAWAAFTACPT